MSYIDQEALVLRLAAQDRNYTLVIEPNEVNHGLLFSKLLLDTSHTFLLGVVPQTSFEVAEKLYLEMLDKIEGAVDTLMALSKRPVDRISPTKLKRSAQHELAHYRAVAELSSAFEGKCAAALAVIVTILSQEGMTIQSACIIELSNTLTTDEHLSAMVNIVSAPFYLRYDHRDLSLGDKAQLQEILNSLSEQTPLTNQLRDHIRELLDPVLYEFNTRFANNE